MPLSWTLFLGRSGIFRIITLVIGVIDLGITADQYIRYISKEEFFLAMVIIWFIISVIWSLLFTMDLMTTTDTLKRVDMGYHLAAGFLLIISSIMMFISVSDAWSPCSHPATLCSNFFRVIAALLGLINGIVYVLLGYTLFKGEQIV